jgi:hypothetical protein
MEIELVSAVRIDANGRQWVPRAAVDTLADPAGRCCSMTGANREPKGQGSLNGKIATADHSTGVGRQITCHGSSVNLAPDHKNG